MGAGDKISVAFVCTGNICRSPMAEALFRHEVKNRGLSDRFDKIDSFGTTGYHVGDPPDRRSIKTCQRHGVDIKHKAQRISKSDFYKFDYLLAMDDGHLHNLLDMKPQDAKTVVKLFGDYRKDKSIDPIVEDPYYGDSNGFEENFGQLQHFTSVFLDQVCGK